MKNAGLRRSISILISFTILSVLLAGCDADPLSGGRPAGNTGQATQSPLDAPRVYDFTACTDPCNATIGSLTFAATNSINISWKYENFPQSAHYVRSWKHATLGVWKTYDCSWSLPPSGEINIKLFDLAGGLAAGKWTLTMTLNNQVLLQKELTIQGSDSHWAPQPPIYACF